MRCPLCKNKDGMRRIPPDEHGVRNEIFDWSCDPCKKFWKSEYLRAYWDGYDQCAAETSHERRAMIEEITRVSLEWQTANRMIWCLVTETGGQARVTDTVAALAQDPGINFQVTRNERDRCLDILAKTDPVGQA